LIKEEAVSCTLILSFLVVMGVALLLLSSTSLGLETAWADSVINNIHLGDDPITVAFDPANGYTYVTNADLGTVSVIDGSTNTVIKNIRVGWSPLGVAFNPANGYIYVAAGTVSVIDGSTNTVIKDIPVGLQPSTVVFDSGSGYIYVANQYSHTVSIIDSSTNTVIDTISKS
jgi:YVTN family beta-propeller protein